MELQYAVGIFQQVGLLKVIGHLLDVEGVALRHPLQQFQQVGMQVSTQPGFGKVL